MPKEDFGNDHRRQEALQLVAQYEEMQRSHTPAFFDLDSLEHIIEYYENHFEFDKALEVIDIAATQHPFSATVLCKKAQLLIDRKDFDEALELVNKARLLAPSELDIVLLQAELFTYLNCYDEAISALHIALDQYTDPESRLDLLLTIADIYEISEDEDNAYRYYKKVLKIKPNNEQALSNIDYLVENGKRYADSIKLHNRIIDRDPYCYLAWYNLGNAYFALEKYDQAIEAYEFVTAINEKYDLAYRNLGECYAKLHQYERSLQLYMEALLHAPEPDDELHYQLAYCHLQLKQYNRALKELECAIDINPNNHEVWFLRGKCWQCIGYSETALDCYNRALSLDPSNHSYLSDIANLHFELGNADTALVFYQYALEKEPNILSHYENLAYVLAHNQQYAEAQIVLQTALHRFDNQADLLAIEAVCQWANGQCSEALLTLTQAMQLSPNAYQAALTLLPAMGNSNEVWTVIGTVR